jgi:hypothetical protein
MHVAVADAPSQWRLGKVLDRNRKKLTDTLNRTRQSTKFIALGNHGFAWDVGLLLWSREDSRRVLKSHLESALVGSYDSHGVSRLNLCVPAAFTDSAMPTNPCPGKESYILRAKAWVPRHDALCPSSAEFLESHVRPVRCRFVFSLLKGEL